MKTLILALAVVASFYFIESVNAGCTLRGGCKSHYDDEGNRVSGSYPTPNLSLPNVGNAGPTFHDGTGTKPSETKPTYTPPRPSISYPSRPNISYPPVVSPSLPIIAPPPLPKPPSIDYGGFDQIKKAADEKRQRMQRDFEERQDALSKQRNQAIGAINNSVMSNVNNINREAEYEYNRAAARSQELGQQLQDYTREHPVDNEGLESAFEAAAAAKNNLGNSVKQFGIQGKKIIGNVESPEPAKAMKSFGAKVSMKNIEHGVSNAVGGLESSEVGRSLHGLGKKASTEKITKGVTNTIDYWGSPAPVEDTNKLRNKVSVENIGKGKAKMVDYVKSTEPGKVVIENVDKTVADIKKTDTYKKFQETVLSTVMTKPTHIQLVDPNHYYTGHGARPVYYINGLNTTFETGHLEAVFLGKMIDRPVYFLYNSTACMDSALNITCVEDWAEAALDRAWPSLLLPGLIGLPAQHNRTTKELAYILYHEKGPITIVSHSQGTLITRNALMTVALLGKEMKMIQEVGWTATGMPMQNSEIWPRPENFDVHVNPNDPIAALVGTRGGGHTVESLQALGDTHEPICNYFPRIYNVNDDTTDFRLTKGPYKAFYQKRKMLAQCHVYYKAGSTQPLDRRSAPDPESNMPYVKNVDDYFDPTQ